MGKYLGSFGIITDETHGEVLEFRISRIIGEKQLPRKKIEYICNYKILVWKK